MEVCHSLAHFDLNDLVEIKDGSEPGLGTNPLIDFVAKPGLRDIPSGVVLHSGSVMPRDDRCANNLQPPRPHATDNFLYPGDHLPC